MDLRGISSLVEETPRQARVVLAVEVDREVDQAQAAEQADRAAVIEALTAELSGPQFSAENSEAPVPEDPYTYVEPPYPTPPANQVFGKVDPEHVKQQAFAREVPAERATRVDGFVRALTRPESLKASTVVLQVDPLTGWARDGKGELLPPPTLAALLKSLPHRLRARQGVASHDLGRTSRLVSPALRAVLGQLDGERCRFPSCDATRHLGSASTTSSWSWPSSQPDPGTPLVPWRTGLGWAGVTSRARRSASTEPGRSRCSSCRRRPCGWP